MVYSATSITIVTPVAGTTLLSVNHEVGIEAGFHIVQVFFVISVPDQKEMIEINSKTSVIVFSLKAVLPSQLFDCAQVCLSTV